jgi:hypothetical protein
LRRFVLPAALLALAGALGLLAIADHSWKQRRMNRAEVLEWSCVHTETHCGGASSHVLEGRWNERQLGYEIAVSVIGGAGIVLAGARAVRG